MEVWWVRAHYNVPVIPVLINLFMDTKGNTDMVLDFLGKIKGEYREKEHLARQRAESSGYSTS